MAQVWRSVESAERSRKEQGPTVRFESFDSNRSSTARESYQHRITARSLLLNPLSVRLGRVIPILDDDIGGRLRLVVEPVIENLLRSSRIASLGIERRSCIQSQRQRANQGKERRTRVVSDHAVSVPVRSAHVAPAVILGCGLRTRSARATREEREERTCWFQTSPA